MELVDPNLPLSVTLGAQQWNQVIALVAHGPWNTVDPLIKAINQQLAAEIAQHNSGLRLVDSDPAA
jgi:hypothetical protein